MQDYKFITRGEERRQSQKRRELVDAILAFTIAGALFGYAIFMFITGGA
jgi:hypothetical protein